MSTTNPQDIELVQTCVSQHGGALRSTLHQPCAKLSCQAGLLNWQVCTCRAQGEQRYSFLANIFGSMLFASAWILRAQRPHATLTFRLRCCVRWAPVAWHWSTPPRSCVMMRRWWSELCSALAWRWSLPLPGVARVLNRPLNVPCWRGWDASDLPWPGCVVCVALFRWQWARMDAQYSCLP